MALTSHSGPPGINGCWVPLASLATGTAPHRSKKVGLIQPESQSPYVTETSPPSGAFQSTFPTYGKNKFAWILMATETSWKMTKQMTDNASKGAVRSHCF